MDEHESRVAAAAAAGGMFPEGTIATQFTAPGGSGEVRLSEVRPPVGQLWSRRPAGSHVAAHEAS